MVALNTPVCDFGWRAPTFALPAANPGSDNTDRHYTLGDCAGDSGLLVMFICNHCPYVKSIITDLVTVSKTLQAAGIGVVAISSNDADNYPEDSFENMMAFARQHGFTFPYLYDESQQVAKAYDAVCTPDFFGFNKGLELQYRGRFDDRGRGAANDAGAAGSELLEAMLLIAETGDGPEEQTPSIGCSIKWKS